MANYYTLAERHGGRWGIAFGAYQRAAVEAERRDYIDHGILARDLCILRTLPGQKSIDAAITSLNAKALELAACEPAPMGDYWALCFEWRRMMTGDERPVVTLGYGD